MADSAKLQRSIEGCRKWPLSAVSDVALNAERLLYPLRSNKRPDRLRPPSGQPIIDQMLDLAHLFTALHPKLWRVVGSYPFKAKTIPLAPISLFNETGNLTLEDANVLSF